MKKFLFIATVLLLLITSLLSCSVNNDMTVSEAMSSESQNEPFDHSETVSEPDEISEPTSLPPIDRTWKYATASFLQPWRFSSYTLEQWEKHCDYLLEAGIDTIIVQNIVDDSNGVIKTAYYPCKIDSSKSFDCDMLKYVLEACKARGMKVIVGLNNPTEWFSITLTDKEWYRREGELGIKIAKEIYDLYKTDYSDVLHGWYFTPEYYSGIGFSENGSEFLNIYLDGLGLIDPAMPMYLSPFLRSAYTPEQTRDEWIDIFKNTRFREGDVFCCQDSVGAGGIMLSQLDGYFSALKQAVDTKKELHFWANNENFTSSGKSSPLDRFVKQMEISSKYVEGHITFSYSHYFCPDIINSKKHHNEYVHYYNTGEYTSSFDKSVIEYDGKRTLISQNAAYKGTINTRNDVFDDDGKKLTDGVIPSPDGNNSNYYGCTCDGGMAIVLDLGKRYDKISEFRLINTFGNWGITKIENVKYYVSDDGKKWKQAGRTVESYSQEIIQSSGAWLSYNFQLVTDEPLGGRYVKVIIDNSGYMWISEICVYNYDER